MGKRGPRPQPTALKIARGNPGKRPLNADEPEPDRGPRVPYAPRHLSPGAAREWRRIAPKLYRAGLLAEIDHTALALYCESYARWVEAKEQVETDGLIVVRDKVDGTGTYELTNPYLSIANAAWEQLKRICAEFGMTPSARSGVKVDKPATSARGKARFFTA